MDLRRKAREIMRTGLQAAPFARKHSDYPDIGDLAVISDRRTAAIVTKDATIVWYCPGRFDAPSLVGGLLDPALAGSWRVVLACGFPSGRRYLDRSAVLETSLGHPNGILAVTDWMNLGHGDTPGGTVCRALTRAPADLTIVLEPRPNYGRQLPALRRAGSQMVIDNRFHLYASHQALASGERIEIQVPRGERSWVVLSDGATPVPITGWETLEGWLSSTLRRWDVLAKSYPYDGQWADQVHASIRALQMLVYEQTGLIAAAATAGLPEIVGGDRNYDYRYSWLRDSGMVVRGLLQFEMDGEIAGRHLRMFAQLRGSGYRPFLDPVFTVGGEPVPMPERLALAGYRRSRPVLAGNPAAKQLQIGSLANLLLGIRELYNKGTSDFPWDFASDAVDFLVRNWSRKGNGIWEEKQEAEFTSSRVFSVCAIEGLAPFSRNLRQRQRWLAAAREIRAAIEQSFLTRSGAYAVLRGSNDVDISAALFPVWGYCAPDDPALEQTIRELEERHSPREGLFHRHLQRRSTQLREGSFLAGTFWMAHYWIARRDLRRARRLIEIGLRQGNDLGLFSEEVDDESGGPLGNLPLGLVHGSFLSAVADFNKASTDEGL